MANCALFCEVEDFGPFETLCCKSHTQICSLLGVLWVTKLSLLHLGLGFRGGFFSSWVEEDDRDEDEVKGSSDLKKHWHHQMQKLSWTCFLPEFVVAVEETTNLSSSSELQRFHHRSHKSPKTNRFKEKKEAKFKQKEELEMSFFLVWYQPKKQ